MIQAFVLGTQRARQADTLPILLGEPKRVEHLLLQIATV
jgi:hypothetical protein